MGFKEISRKNVGNKMDKSNILQNLLKKSTEAQSSEEESPELKKLRETQQFLLGQVVRLPEENKKLEDTIAQKMKIITKLNKDIDLLEKRRASLESLKRQKEEKERELPFVETSILNLEKKISASNQKIHDLETKIQKLKDIVVKKQAILDKSAMYYQDILSQIGSDDDVKDYSLKELRIKLEEVSLGAQDLNLLLEKRKEYEKQYGFKVKHFATEISQCQEQIKQLHDTIDRKKDEKERLIIALNKEREKPAQLEKEIIQYRNKLKNLMMMSKQTKFSYDDDVTLYNRAGPKKVFDRNSIAYMNFHYLKSTEEQPSRYRLEQLMRKKINITNKLNEINSQMSKSKDKP